MQSRAAIIMATALAVVSTMAASTQSAIVTIEAIKTDLGGLPQLNTTVTIPLNKAFTGGAVLASVGALYLTGSSGIPLDSITCTPFKNPNGTGVAGTAFNATTPSVLSTNGLELGSIVCVTNQINQSPPVLTSTPTPTGSATSSAKRSSGAFTSSAPALSTRTTTPTTKSTIMTATSRPTTEAKSTVTSVLTPTVVQSKTVTPTSPQASASPSLDNAGNSLLSSSEFFSGLALAGLGLAFVL